MLDAICCLILSLLILFETIFSKFNTLRMLAESDFEKLDIFVVFNQPDNPCVHFKIGAVNNCLVL